jgi:macrolide transport system ATP-binding/permease protein
MTILEINNIKKEIGEKILFEIKSLKVYSGDKIGLVGKNGAGKTTLLNVIAGIEDEYMGEIILHGTIEYIEQLKDIDLNDVPAEGLKRSQIVNRKMDSMSGGEKTQLKIIKSLNSNCQLLLADEPTCNLDIDATKELEDKLVSSERALILVSHDKTLLDKVCNKILEIDKGKVTLFNGNYSSYITQTESLKSKESEEYIDYINEKKRLTDSVHNIIERGQTMKKTPSRMGNSEARLMKGSSSAKRKNIDMAANAMKGRLERLEVKTKPFIDKEVTITIPENLKIQSKNVITLRNLKKSFDHKLLFEAKDISINSGVKTAIIGKNGSGKTTLLNMILNQEQGIITSSKIKIGYFSQDLKILDTNKTILENVMQSSIYNETIARTVLGNLMFRRDDVYKRVDVLSGGERVRISLAKVILSEMNVLILDEPTNFLDIKSREALINVIKNYDGTVIFVSHDRNFISELADHIIMVKDNKITKFDGKYSDLIKDINSKKNKNENEIELLQLEIRLSSIVGKISSPKNNEEKLMLEDEYNNVIEKIKRLKINKSRN